MEYEGYGCPELFNIYQCEKNARSTAKPTRLNIDHNIDVDIGETHNALKELIRTDSIKKDIDGKKNFLYDLMHASIHRSWDKIQAAVEDSDMQMKQSQSKSREYMACDSEENDTSIKDKINKLIRYGYLTYVIEYYLLEISLASKYNYDELRERHVERLIQLLVNSQEYSLCISVGKRLGSKKMNIHSQSLMNYVISITTKSPLRLFMLMNSLKHLSYKAVTAEKQEEYFFLVNNQSAFCKSIAGDKQSALVHEFMIFDYAKSLFYRHISCINATRILLNLEDSRAIYPILAGFNTISECKYKHSYQILYGIYLSRWSTFIGENLNITYHGPCISNQYKHYGNNWRVLQAQKRLSTYTNYSNLTVWNQTNLNSSSNTFQISYSTEYDKIEVEFKRYIESIMLSNRFKLDIEACRLTINGTLEDGKIKLFIRSY